MEADNELVTRREAARRLHVGLRQIQRGISDGELPVIAIGAWPRVRWSDVLRWLERRCAARPELDDPAAGARRGGESGP